MQPKRTTEVKNLFDSSLPVIRVWHEEKWKKSTIWNEVELGNGHYWDPQKLSEKAREIIYSLVAEVERLRQEKDGDD